MIIQIKNNKIKAFLFNGHSVAPHFFLCGFIFPMQLCDDNGTILTISEPEKYTYVVNIKQPIRSEDRNKDLIINQMNIIKKQNTFIITLLK